MPLPSSLRRYKDVRNSDANDPMYSTSIHAAGAPISDTRRARGWRCSQREAD
jgi:hypothetical protein